MAEYTAKIRIDLGGLLPTLQSAIQLSLERVAFALTASKEAKEEKLELPEAQIKMTLGSSGIKDFEEARSDHERWALGNGLRDCAEALHIFLDEGRKVCAFFSLGPTGMIRGEDWNRAIVEDARLFHQFGLPKKLSWLRDTYDSLLASESSSSLLTVNAGRNCLVHRQGIVQEIDKNSDDGLTVRWTNLELEVAGNEGQRPLLVGDTVQAGERVSVAQNSTSKTFAIGYRISFSTQEFSGLCWNFFVFGSQLVAAIKKYGRSRGFKFDGTSSKVE